MTDPKPTAGSCEACGQWVERARKTGLDDSLVQVLASRLQEIDPEHHALIASLRAEIERLIDPETWAEAEHNQWMRWAKTLLETEPGISESRRKRWATLFVPYSELSAESQEQDRKEARVAIEAALARKETRPC